MPGASKTPQDREYHGSCHCGAFQFTLAVPPIEEALMCNCSICSKNGYLWTFPRRSQFAVVKGDEETTLKSYLFGKRGMAHKFCPTCGTSVMEVRMPGCSDEGAPEIGINIRALQDFDLDALKIEPFEEGINMEPAYQVPAPVPTGPVPEGSTVYHGSCHCGAVAYTVLGAEEITEVTSCNCSICSRDAVLWTYPESSSVSWRGLDTAAVEYTFKRRQAFHGFCKHCGVSVFEKFRNTDTPQDNKMGLNVRTINPRRGLGDCQWVGVDVGKLKMRFFDGKTNV
ncbi:glutathione-dependent formaldehyde-activating enzyme [Mycena sanguinolenta]|nr:glutathione-dependent formaldehyde-activating enzyme [Mycena sanguinolenta]